MIRAYHFVGEKLRDGRPVPEDGEWLIHEGGLNMCAAGLHASRQPYDALRYAPGPILCIVDLDGEIIEESDKLVAEKRRIVARHDATPIIRKFIRHLALATRYLWDMPQVVRYYLHSGEGSERNAAFYETQHYVSINGELGLSEKRALAIAKRACSPSAGLNPIRTVKDIIWEMRVITVYGALSPNMEHHLRLDFREMSDALFSNTGDKPYG